MSLRLRVLIPGCLVMAMCLGPARPAVAQEKLNPHALSFAMGGDIGFWIPDEQFDFTFTPNGFAEFYLTHNLSVRGMVGWTRPNFVDGGRDLDQWRGLFSVVWNWEQGLWHPFILGGVGLVSVQYTVGDGDPVGSRIQEHTVHGGVGVEYFARPKTAFKFEVRYDWARPIPDIAASPSGLALSVGLKKYF
jgi:hypothetical protein